jgi:predicted acylesterase/phospholipase RssA
VVPAAIGRARLDQFCRRLTAALGSLAPTRMVTREEMSRAVPAGPDADASTRRWLHAIEESCDYTVLVADASTPDWTARCVRQADRILVVGDPRLDPSPTEAELLVARTTGGRTTASVVLVHPDDTVMPSGTAAWLDARPGLSAHHVRLLRDADYRRVARLVTGRAVGLVLGGGGAKGLAHLGVIRALEEAGVPIDAIGGTSIGAIMATTVGMGWDDDIRIENSLAAFARTRFLVGLTFPAVSVASAKKLTRMLRDPRNLGDTGIEDMWVPYFCVSTNLSSGEMVVHDRGPAWLAVRASIAIPGVLPPVWHDGDLLVDGGVVNDLPVDVMRQRIEGRVVAVALDGDATVALDGDATARRSEPAFDPGLSGWRLIRHRFGRPSGQDRLPGPLQILGRARDVGVRNAQRHRHLPEDIDLLLRPPASGFGSFDFRAAAHLIDIGYRHAAAQLSEGVPFLP